MVQTPFLINTDNHWYMTLRRKTKSSISKLLDFTVQIHRETKVRTTFFGFSCENSPLRLTEMMTTLDFEIIFRGRSKSLTLFYKHDIPNRLNVSLFLKIGKK